MAELTARAHEISQQAGSKVAAAMKDVIGAAAGLTGFAVESARDLIQYMVRRGQMTQMEGEKLLREVEAVHGTRSPSPRADAGPRPAARGAAPSVAPARPTADKHGADVVAADKPARKATGVAPAVEKPPRKSAGKAATPKPKAEAKPAAKKAPAKGAAKKAEPKGSASRASAPSRPKAAAKSAPVRKKK